jgi:hypothetical protein
MGIIAAIFATGVMAVAAQQLPFGPSIGGFSRYDVQEDRPAIVPVLGRALDRKEYNELSYNQPGKFGDEGTAHGVPILPVDSILIGAVEKFSNGALSAGKPLDTIHPDYLDELFGQRVGIEFGGNHVAMNLPDKRLAAMDVVGLYTRLIPSTAQKDAEFAKLRSGGALKPIILTANSSDTFLVVRVNFKMQAADQKDRVLRFSPGSVRLVVNTPQPGTGESAFKDYFPIGTLQDARTLYLNKPDDFLFVQMAGEDHGADLVFIVNKKQFDTNAPSGTFIEFKRLARVDLGHQEIQSALKLKTDPNFNVMRKPAIVPPPEAGAPTPTPEQGTPTPPTPEQPTPTPTPTPTPEPAAATTFQVTAANASSNLPVPVTGPTGQEGTLVQVPGGTAVITGMKLKTADINSTRAEQTQPLKITQFALPEGQAMIQVTGTSATAAPWGFASEPDQYELVDATAKRYQPYGVFASYTSGGAEKIYLRYVDATSISGAATLPDGTPRQITFFYVVPSGTAVTEFDDHMKKVRDLTITAK